MISSCMTSRPSPLRFSAASAADPLDRMFLRFPDSWRAVLRDTARAVVD
jgi:hypothetical protein